MKTFLTLIIAVVIIYESHAQQIEAASYNSPTTGTLTNVPFTLTNSTNNLLSNYDLSTSDFSTNALSNSQQCIQYADSDNWTITFDTPIENLRLYCKFWRTMEVSFNHPFTILSGGSGLQNPSANLLNTVEFTDGIIEFSNPVTTLNVTVISGGGIGHQAMTFGVVSQNLSTTDFNNSLKKIKITPNPSSNIIKVTGLLKAEPYTLYTILGEKVNNGILINNEKIGIQNLLNGMYFLKFENGQIIKFLKD